MRINVHAGHTKQTGKAPGASGYVHESVEDRKIKDTLIKILRERDATVHDCTADGEGKNDNLYQIVKKCNAHEVDLDVSIHLNCSNGAGHGTETWIYSSSSKAKPYAKKIDKNLAALGFTDRGVKARSDLYVLHRTKAPALLIEVFFCDNKYDCALYKKLGVEKIANAIADGIIKATKPKKEAKPKTEKTQEPAPKPKKKSNAEIAKEVIDGKWGNGETRKKKLTAAGYDYKTVQKLVNEMLRK